LVVAHLLDVVEERLHGAEELIEVGALAEALLVALDRVPLDTDDVLLGSSMPRAISYARQCGEASRETAALLYAQSNSSLRSGATR
jgi:hypothetical protein